MASILPFFNSVKVNHPFLCYFYGPSIYTMASGAMKWSSQFANWNMEIVDKHYGL